eukprot:SM000401S15614  [mRNA]  locus=s401:41224:47918:- [translate_table: standard]
MWVAAVGLPQLRTRRLDEVGGEIDALKGQQQQPSGQAPAAASTDGGGPSPGRPGSEAPGEASEECPPPPKRGARSRAAKASQQSQVHDHNVGARSPLPDALQHGQLTAHDNGIPSSPAGHAGPILALPGPEAAPPQQPAAPVEDDADSDQSWGADPDNEMILMPEDEGPLDPKVLASLPASVQLELMVQMREQLVAQNREKFRQVAKVRHHNPSIAATTSWRIVTLRYRALVPSNFSEMQIQGYLKTVAMRRDIDKVQKAAAGVGIAGMPATRIASETGREFIFSSSYTPPEKTPLTTMSAAAKRVQARAASLSKLLEPAPEYKHRTPGLVPSVSSMLASLARKPWERAGTGSVAVKEEPDPDLSLSIFDGPMASSGHAKSEETVDVRSVTRSLSTDGALATASELLAALESKGPAGTTMVALTGQINSDKVGRKDSSVPLYRDSNGIVRVSRRRGMGLRMSRDLQHNLNLMREKEQEQQQQQQAAGDTKAADVVDDSKGRGTEHTSNGLSIAIEAGSRDHSDEDSTLFANLVRESGESGDAHVAHESPKGSQGGAHSPETEAGEGDFSWEEGPSSAGVVDGGNEHKAGVDAAETGAGPELTQEPPLSSRNATEEGKCSDESDVDWEDGSGEVQDLGQTHVAAAAAPEDLHLQRAIQSSLQECAAAVPRAGPEGDELEEALRRSLEDFGGRATSDVQPRHLGGVRIGVSPRDHDRTRSALEESSVDKATSRAADYHGEEVELRVSNEKGQSLEEDRRRKGKAIVEESAGGGPSNEPPSSKPEKPMVAAPLVADVVHTEAPVQVIEHHPQVSLSASLEDAMAAAQQPVNSPGLPGDAQAGLERTADLEREVDDLQQVVPGFEPNPSAGYAQAADEAAAVGLSELDREELLRREMQVEEEKLRLAEEAAALKDELQAELQANTALDEESQDLRDEEFMALRKEEKLLRNLQKRNERDAENVSSDMFQECQELLQIFGLPYIIAPMEAEAQCAFMDEVDFVDGIVTDDCDAFLFGGRSVYRNLFDERKYVETYYMKDIEGELGLSRDKLIRMAMLLGSDYTPGISGIGIVNAIEVVNAYPGNGGLEKFKDWLDGPDERIFDHVGGGHGKGLSSKAEEGVGGEPLEEPELMAIRRAFEAKHRNMSRNWNVPESFPSAAVMAAYKRPQVDRSTERCTWGRPDLDALRKFCHDRLGWSREKTDDATQMRLEAFYTFNQRFAKIRSKRIQKAVTRITGKRSEELMDLPHHLISDPPQKKAKKVTGAATHLTEIEQQDEEQLALATSEDVVEVRQRQRQARGRGKKPAPPSKPAVAKVADSGKKKASRRPRGGKSVRKQASSSEEEVGGDMEYEGGDESSSGSGSDVHGAPSRSDAGAEESSSRSRRKAMLQAADGSSELGESNVHVVSGVDGAPWPALEAAGSKGAEDSPGLPAAYATGGGFCADEEQEEHNDPQPSRELLEPTPLDGRAQEAQCAMAPSDLMVEGTEPASTSKADVHMQVLSRTSETGPPGSSPLASATGGEVSTTSELAQSTSLSALAQPHSRLRAAPLRRKRAS